LSGTVPLEALRLATGDAMGSCEAPATADMLRSSCAGCGWVCGRFLDG
jgi:hypothetical protein